MDGKNLIALAMASKQKATATRNRFSVLAEIDEETECEDPDTEFRRAMGAADAEDCHPTGGGSTLPGGDTPPAPAPFARNALPRLRRLAAAAIKFGGPCICKD